MVETGSGAILLQLEGLRNDRGRVRASLFSSKTGFPSKQTVAERTIILSIDGDRATGFFKEVVYGDYSIAVIHDENMNKKMDFRFKVIPSEGHGASNNPVTTFGPPSFSQAMFSLEEKLKKINIRIQY